MPKLPCFKNVKATLLCKKYFNEDYHHELDSGLKTKIQQLWAVGPLADFLCISYPRLLDREFPKVYIQES